jgi:hypothetical protein
VAQKPTIEVGDPHLNDNTDYYCLATPGGTERFLRAWLGKESTARLITL